MEKAELVPKKNYYEHIDRANQEIAKKTVEVAEIRSEAIKRVKAQRTPYVNLTKYKGHKHYYITVSPADKYEVTDPNDVAIFIADQTGIPEDVVNQTVKNFERGYFTSIGFRVIKE